MKMVDGGKSSRVTLRDTSVGGLALAVGRNTQRWTLEYKAPLPGGGWSGGKRLVLGDLATMDIEAARAVALAAKRQVAEGLDPAAAKRARRAVNVEASVSRTLRTAVDRFTDERAVDWAAATQATYALDFRLIVDSLDADLPLAAIERDALVEFIDGHLAEARRNGKSGVRRAMRLADLLAQVWWQAGPGTPSRPGWGWPGVNPQVADRIPVVGRHRITSRSRVLSEKEIRALWPILRDGVPNSGIGPGPRMVLMISLATGLRVGAIALCRVADLDLDPEPVVGARDHGPTIRIPAEDGRKATAKARREGSDLILPLSGMAVALFREALALRRDPASPHVFDGLKGKPLLPATASAALRGLRKVSDAVPPDIRAHDMRRTMRSLLGEIDHGGAFEDEERLLGHVVGGSVARTYDRGRRLARLRPLAEAWAERLEQIVSAKPAEVRRLRDPA